MRGNDFFSGRLLLALPGIGDDRFAHAVIYLVHHDASGALGIGIGDVLAMRASEVFTAAGLSCTLSPDPPVLRGGPVEPARGFVLHSREWMGEDSVGETGHGDLLPALSGSRQVLDAIAGGRGPLRWQIALGYAGWGPGQLEEEVLANAWHVTAYDDGIAFGTPPGDRWQAVLRRDQIDPARFASGSGRA